jgi:hypothetical protein
MEGRNSWNIGIMEGWKREKNNETGLRMNCKERKSPNSPGASSFSAPTQ